MAIEHGSSEKEAWEKPGLAGNEMDDIINISNFNTAI